MKYSSQSDIKKTHVSVVDVFCDNTESSEVRGWGHILLLRREPTPET
jgi:hypothetical protein